jgi:NitT/TauT family transport system permease protein
MSDRADFFGIADAAPAPPDASASTPRLLRLVRSVAFRRVAALLALALIWQVAAIAQANPIMLPSFTRTLAALWEALADEGLAAAAAASVRVLLEGYAVGVLLALILVSLAVANSFARETLVVLTAMLNPLPAIALLPMAMLWFGLGEMSLIFVLVHSVLWPFALAALSGFQAVPETLRLVGRNYGLRGPSYVALILVPAALPAIISGLKIAWAFGWRTLIAAELVFGVSSRQGGLGWFIFRNRNELFTDKVFAGLLTVIIIGLLAETVVFRTIEAATIRRWGMQR